MRSLPRQHLGRLDGGVPPGGSVRHHLTIGQQAAVTALTDLLSQPDRVRPGAVIFADSVGTGGGLGYGGPDRMERT